MHKKTGDKKMLIVTAVEQERDAVLEGIGKAPNIDVLVAGVGPVVSAITTTHALANQRYDLVINMGIGGGFRGKADIGDVVVATEVVHADFGVETPSGFYFAEKVQLGLSKVFIDDGLRKRMVQAFEHAGLQVVSGPVLTVSTVTGTELTAADLQKRVPKATAEGMEGFGVVMAGRSKKVPAFEVRAISNLVGKRDKASWKIPDALRSLTLASRSLMEVWR
jgi:futalosine hydrolase